MWRKWIYLEMAWKIDRLQELDDIEFLIVISVDQINRSASTNPDDISTFNVEALSLIFMDQCDCSTSCYEYNAILN